MSISSIVATATTGISPRITLVGLLPSTLLVLFLVFLIFSFSIPPTPYPDFNLVSKKLSSISLEQIAAIVFAIIAISLIIEPLQIALLRIFEGYWNKKGFVGKIRSIGLQIQLEEFRKYKVRGRPTSEYFPASYDRFLPTSFGNNLRAAEDMAGNRYGLDTVFFWPRMYAILPDGMKNITDDKRNQLDLLTRFCIIFIIATIASVITYLLVVYSALSTDYSLILLTNLVSSGDTALGLMIFVIAFVKYGAWLIIPSVTYGLYVLSYKSLLTIAVSYGKTLKVAFDLYRFDLIKALHWKISSRADEEIETNDNLRRFLQNETQGVQYFHGEVPKSEETRTISKKTENMEYVEKISKSNTIENIKKLTSSTSGDNSTSSTDMEVDTEGTSTPADTRSTINEFKQEIRLAGRILLIIGIVLVGIGLVLSIHWIAYFTNTIYTKGIPLIYLTLDKKANMNFYANLISKDIDQIFVYLSAKPAYGTQSELKVLPAISESITNPSGKKILERNFVKQSIYFFEPKSNGTYILKLMNLSNEPIVLNGLFGYFPYLGNEGLINSDEFQELFAGSILLLLGLAIVLVGIIVILLGVSKAAKINIAALNI